jgi:hypothetical protein
MSVSLERLPHESGSVPLRLLEYRYIQVRLERLPHEAGRVPLRLLVLRYI